MSRHLALFRVRKGASVLVGALLLSLVAVAGMSAIVGGLALLVEGEVLWDRPCLAMKSCLLAGSEQKAVALVWMQPRGTSPGKTYLGDFTLGPGEAEFQPWDAPREPTCIAVSPALDRVFIGTLGGGIYATSKADPQESPLVLTTAAGRGLHTLCCSPDGRYLLASGTSGLCTWDLLHNRVAWRRSDVEANCLCICRDSRQSICGLASGEIVELDLASGEVTRVIAKHQGAVIVLSLSQDEEFLVSISGSGQTQLVQRQGGRLVWQSPPEPACTSPPRLAVFSPDGKYLVTTAREDSRVLIKHSLASGARIGELRGHSRSVLGAAFAADGRLVSWSADGTFCTWDAMTGRLLTETSLAVGVPAG